MSTGRNPLITKIALAILDANNIFIVNALFEGIFPFLNLLMSDSTGSPLLFPYMVSQPDPGYPSTSQALLAADMWSVGMTVCSGLVTYQAYDAPDSEKTKWAVAVGHALYHLFIVVKSLNGPTWVGPYIAKIGLPYEDYSEELLRWANLIIHTLLALGFARWIMKTNETYYPSKRVVGLTQEAIEEEERRRREEEEAGKVAGEIVTPGAAALEGARKRK